MTTATASDSAPAPAVPAPPRVLVGIAYISLSIVLFAIMNAIIKQMVGQYSVVQVAFFRNLFGLLPLVILVYLNGGPGLLMTRRPGMHFLRSLLGVGNLLMMFWSLSLLPLPDATALTFSGPLFLTALSVVLLGETVGIHRWGAVIVGFIGVIIMVNPSADIVANAGSLVGVTAAFIYALSLIVVRKLTPTESPIAITFYFTLLACVVAGLGCVLVPIGWAIAYPEAAPLDLWRPVPPFHLFLLATTGFIGGTGHYLVAMAHRNAPAAVVSPFSYAQILWATVIGYVVFAELPSWEVITGSPLVIAAGLYIVYRESRKPKAA